MQVRDWKSILALFIALLGGELHATTITDIAGREVTIDAPVKKIILGEGRFLAVLGALGVDKPLSYVAGMMNEFRRFDPAGFRQYQKVFPDIDSVPTFGQTTEQSVNVEQAILLRPDVAIFGLHGHGPGARSKHIIEKLTAAKIPIVFIDFRQNPLENTPRSIEIIGRLLGLEERAAEFIDLYKSELNKVLSRLKNNNQWSCPTVFIELRVDTKNDCCLSVAKGMFADLIKAAGGCNIAEDLLSGAVGKINKEYIIDIDPDIYIATAVGHLDSSKDPASSSGVVLGPNVSYSTAMASFKYILKRPGFSDLNSVRTSQAYAIWHHFYNSPLNIYALQKLAQWFHPELFNDLNPEILLSEMLIKFDPVSLDGVYAVSLE